MWKLKDHAEGKTREENAIIMKGLLEALKDKIPEIQFLEVGSNVAPTDAAFDIVLYSEFRDEAALSVYQDNLDHLKVADFVSRIKEQRVLVDYIV
jgi:hypothetical protein